LNRPHVRELAPQALVVFLGSGEPYSVIRSVRRFVPQDQHDFFFHIDCNAAKHQTRIRRLCRNRIKHERVWNRLAPHGQQARIQSFRSDVVSLSHTRASQASPAQLVFDYAGLSRCSRYRACSCCLPHISRASASGLTVYGAEYPPRISSVYASLSTSRYPAQDSRPSGSLLLSRKALSSSASCRFIPAHCNGGFSPDYLLLPESRMANGLPLGPSSTDIKKCSSSSPRPGFFRYILSLSRRNRTLSPVCHLGFG
jgi:hypothetical protein